VQHNDANFGIGTLEHDPEKWVSVFGKDHAPPKGRVAKVRIISTVTGGIVPPAILRDALAALGLLRMRSVVDALLKRRDDVGKVFLDHLVDAEERRPADK
jgi:hypothetical protein